MLSSLFLWHNYPLDLYNGDLETTTVLCTRNFTQVWQNSYWLIVCFVLPFYSRSDNFSRTLLRLQTQRSEGKRHSRFNPRVPDNFGKMNYKKIFLLAKALRIKNCYEKVSQKKNRNCYTSWFTESNAFEWSRSTKNVIPPLSILDLIFSDTLISEETQIWPVLNADCLLKSSWWSFK